MKTKHKIEENDAELSLGLILMDTLLFGKFFMASDLSLEPTIPQKCIFMDNSKRILLCTSRNVAKTISLRTRLLKDIATFLPSQDEDKKNKQEEILIVAPAFNHLSPLIERLYADTNRIPLVKCLISSKRGGDSPTLTTKTGLTIYGRIEGSAGDGRNMQGPHPIKIYGDEMEFGDRVNHQYRLAGAMPDCQWVYAGVPNGDRNTPFYRLDTSKDGAKNWSRHKFSMLTANPRFLTDREYRKEITREYGGKDAPEFITQIKGEWGDEAMSSFPSSVICWRKNNVDCYVSKNVWGTLKEPLEYNTLPTVIRVPQVQCHRAVIGWDYGLSPDPTNFTIAVQYEERGTWFTYARVALYQVPLPKQIDVLKYLFTAILNFKCEMVSVDSPETYQMLLADENLYLFQGHVKETKQAGTTEMDKITGKIITEDMESDPEVMLHRADGKIIKMRRKHFLTEMLKRYMMNSIIDVQTEPRLELGYDNELETEMMSTVEIRTDLYVTYNVPLVNRVRQDQCVDSLRAAVDCIAEVEHKPYEPGFDYEAMVKAMGWGGRVDRQDVWRAPYEHA